MKRRIYDKEGHVHFITFSCYKRRRLLDVDEAKKIVIGVLSYQLKKQKGKCLGFVIMPEHVHALVWFPENEQLSHFMKQWKQISSSRIKRMFKDKFPMYAGSFDYNEPVWKQRYYSFNVFSENKLIEKLHYMHNNPVKAGLAKKACDWNYSSAGFYEKGKSVGVAIWKGWG